MPEKASPLVGLLSVIAAGAVLVGTGGLGVVVHELSHALGLRMAGVAYTVEFLPGRGDPGGSLTFVRRPLARVTPTRLPGDLSPWRLRAAAIMPFSLAIPLVLVPLGIVPDPFRVGNQWLELATIVWLGCAIPSPRDFSLLWYPERSIAAHREPTSAGE